MKEDQFLKVAKQAALEAGLMIYKSVGKITKAKIKNEDKSNLVTEVDLKSEKIIIKNITKHFPSHNIICEETGERNKKSEYTWAVDPLDGTISFVHGMPHFSVAIGLLKKNEPILGVIYNVLSKDIYFAKVGGGAYHNNKRIRVSKVRTLEEAVLNLGLGSIKRRPPKVEKYVLPLINKVAYPYSICSASSAYTFVSSGHLEGTLDIGWLWDFVAGTVIIREAGGRVTDFEGNEPDWSQERLDIVASNGLIHEAILKELKK